MEKIIDKSLCTSCSACYAVCPTHSIKMVADEKGFLYPQIMETCIDCGKCVATCPRLNIKKEPVDFEQKAFAALTKDSTIWKKSSSGGAFTEICKAFGDENTIICGAAWDGLSVHEVCVEGVDNIQPLCKSKYVASNSENVFCEIKDYLKKGRKVIFCGTPCQVSGLKHSLNKDYKNLLLIDLICHGVGSPVVFQKCVDRMSKDLSEEIKLYEFRSKSKVYDRDHITKLKLKSQQDLYIINDRYIQLFVKQHCLRSSCGANCVYRDENRQGDITIGDFKGLKEVFPKLKGTKKNYSTIVINNEKGESLLPRLEKNMKMLSCNIESIKKYNPIFYRHTYFSDEQEEFFDQFSKNEEKTIDDWTNEVVIYKKTFKRKIYDFLPQGIRKYL